MKQRPYKALPCYCYKVLANIQAALKSGKKCVDIILAKNTNTSKAFFVLLI